MIVAIVIIVILVVFVILIIARGRETFKLYQHFESPGILHDVEIVNDIKKKYNIDTPLLFYEEDIETAPANSYHIPNLDLTEFTIEKINGKPSIKYKFGTRNILCKTKQCFDILKSYDTNNLYNIRYLGFTSRDILDAGREQNYEKFIHIAGKSPFKGTADLTLFWDAEWPVLTVYCFEKKNKYKTAPNIIYKIGKLLEEEITEIINTHGIHICSSLHEGFGHYIHEAKSARALILYTNGPSMNETFKDGIDGISIAAEIEGNEQLCPRYRITQAGLINAVTRVLAMNIYARRRMGESARQSFLRGRENFIANFKNLFARRPAIPHKIHLVWIDKSDHYQNKEYPEFYEKNINFWKKNHPDYEIKIWRGRDCFDIVKSQYSLDYVEKYKKFGLMNKCDLVRFIIVNKFGGFYTDMDIVSRLPLKEYQDSIFYFEPVEHHTKTQPFMLSGFFGSVPNNPFISGWIEEVMTKKHDDDILKFAGPAGLFNYFNKSNDLVNIGDTCNISPFLKETGKYICPGTFNKEKAVIWWDTTEWGDKNNIGETIPMFLKEIKNPLNNQNIVWKNNVLIDKTIISLISNLSSIPENEIIETAAAEYLFLAHARPDIKIYIKASNDIEEICLLNGINNVILK